MKTEEILKSLCEAVYTPDKENETALLIIKYMEPLCDSITRDALGNVICTLNPDGDRHTVLSAHMDKIGLVVTSADKATGMLHFARAGSPDMRTLTASAVKVAGTRLLRGCVTSTPPHLSSGDRTKAPSSDMLFVDCGLPYEEIKDIAPAGTTVLYDSPVKALTGDKLSGAYMDNSAGCTAVIKAMEMHRKNGTDKKITAVFTTREEVGKGGATAVFTALKPQRAFITDVSFGRAPGIPEECSSPLSSGAMICISPVLQTDVSRGLIKTAEKNNIPYTTEIMASRTMTDSDVAVTAGEGILTGLVSVPLLNMHTPVETLSLSDIEAVACLLYHASEEE